MRSNSQRREYHLKLHLVNDAADVFDFQFELENLAGVAVENGQTWVSAGLSITTWKRQRGRRS